jgi:hypothetical protein
MTADRERAIVVQRLARVGLVGAVLGGAATVFGYWHFPARFYASYLTAYFFWLDITLGCLGLALLHGLTGGGWGVVIRRVVEAGYQTLPWMIVLFVPLWLGVAKIYPWTDPQLVEQHASVARKAAYLNVGAWHVRAMVIFGVWIVIALLLDLASPKGDTTPDSPRARRLQTLGGLGFIAYGVSITVAAVDWVMSLEPEWYSTMYGVLYMAEEAVAGLAAAILVVSLFARYEPWSTAATVARRIDLGNLLLAFVMFWAYVHFMQFLIIWSADLPEENVWYLRRSAGGWLCVSIGLAALHFAAPFLLLLSRRLKRTPVSIAQIAALLLAVHYVNLLWMIVPGLEHGTHSAYTWNEAWLDLAAWTAIGGGWLAMFAWRLSARVRVPIFDPDLTETRHDVVERAVAT